MTIMVAFLVAFATVALGGYIVGVIGYKMNHRDDRWNWRLFTAPFSDSYWRWLDVHDPGWWRRP